LFSNSKSSSTLRRSAATFRTQEKENTMNRFRLLATVTILTFALTLVAQQATTKAAPSGAHSGVPTAEVQLKFFATKLGLTADQQDKMKPILQELHDTTVKLVEDDTISSDERMSKVIKSRYAADSKIRAILSDDQQKKLDQVEHEPHPELHGGVK
jgi:Spy/CpxP family protein refolding chaperone